MSTRNDAPLEPAEVTAFVGLGSNLGDRTRHLRSALEALSARPEIVVETASPVYESRAHTLTAGESNPDFLNAVVRLTTTLRAEELLVVLHEIERGAGRRRAAERRWSPRTLDLDLLIFGSEAIRREGLEVPHPRMGARRFVLQPLVDLDPSLYVPPPYDRTAGELLEMCDDPDRPVKIRHSL